MSDRIDLNHKGNLDDVVIENVDMFRLEYMAGNSIWIRCYRKDEHGGDVVFWLNAKGNIKGWQGEL